MCVGSVHARLLRVHQQQHQQTQTSYRRSIDSMGLINYKHTPKTQAYERGWRRQCPADSPNNQLVGYVIRCVSRLVGLGPPRSQRGDRAYSIKAINKSYLAQNKRVRLRTSSRLTFHLLLICIYLRSYTTIGNPASYGLVVPSCILISVY